MRVAFLDQFSEIGGAQRGLLDIATAAAARGWRVEVLIPEGGPLVDHLSARSIGVRRIPCGPYRSGSKSAADLLRFLGDVRSQTAMLRGLETPDLFYVNGPRVLPAAAWHTAGATPLLFHAHSRIPEGFSTWLARRSLRKSRAAVIACSRYVAEPLADSAARLEIIPNGVAEIPFVERPRGRSDWRIGLFGRISPEKGQAEFVGCAARLHSEFPDARFVMCGAPLFSAPDYAESVRRSAAGLPVEFRGWQDDVAGVYATLDLLAVPSKREGMGRVIVEAFAAGVPVVAFPEGGIPEVISDGETGFLTTDTTAEALAARIRDVMTATPESIRRVVHNARRAWEESFAVQIFERRITDRMEEVVAAWKAGHETAARPAYK